MDILKDYIKQNNSSVYDKDLPAGNEERFDAAYEAYRHKIRFKSSVKRRKKAFWKVALIPVAASFALILIARLLLDPLMDDRKATGLTADQIYQNYLEDVNTYTNEIIAMTERMSDEQTIFAMQTLKQILNENRPITDMIPRNIPAEARASAVRQYTERNITALDEYKHLLTQMIE